MPTTRISSDDAATKTMERLASEHGGTAFLSADIVATDGDGNPIVSVIHLEDRRHWNLVVRSELPQVGEVTKVAPVAKLPDALLTADDGDYIFVIGMQCSWTVTVQVLEPATI